MANGFVLKSTNQVKKRAKAVVKVAKTQQNIFIFVSSSKKVPIQLYSSTASKKISVIMWRWDENEKKISKILPPLCALLFVSTKMRTMSQQCVNSWQIADFFMDDAFPIEKNQVENGIFSLGKKSQFIVNSANNNSSAL